MFPMENMPILEFVMKIQFLSLIHILQKPANDRDCSNAEQGQEQFGEYFHTESHTTILGKVGSGCSGL